MVTFRGWAEEWIRRRERERLRSLATLRSHWRCHLSEAAFVDARLDTVRRRDVRAFLRERIVRSARRSRRTSGGRETVELARSLSPRTLRSIAQTLHGLFAAAVEEDLLEANPAAGVRLALPAMRPRWEWLSRQELEAVETSADVSIEARSIYLTAAYTGLRKGELWGLRWSDVFLDDERPRVVVARSFEGPTKTGRVEPVPLIGRAKRVLSAWRDEVGDRGLVFPGRRGGLRGASDTAGWADYWARGARRPGWRTRLGIERRVRFHDFRHTAATHLLMGTWGRRWSLVEVRDFLRHRSIRETERYAHFAAGSLFDAARGTDG